MVAYASFISINLPFPNISKTLFLVNAPALFPNGLKVIVCHCAMNVPLTNHVIQTGLFQVRTQITLLPVLCGAEKCIITSKYECKIFTKNAGTKYKIYNLCRKCNINFKFGVTSLYDLKILVIVRG